MSIVVIAAGSNFAVLRYQYLDGKQVPLTCASASSLPRTDSTEAPGSAFPDPVMNTPLYPHLQAAPFLSRIVIVWRAATLTRLSYHQLLAHGDSPLTLCIRASRNLV